MSDNNRLAVEEAKKALVQDTQERMKQCGAEIEAALKKYNCDLVARVNPTVDSTDGTLKIQAHVGIYPKGN